MGRLLLQDPRTVTPFTEEDRYGRNSVPQSSYVGVLTPSSSECGVFGDKAFQEVMGASLGAQWIRICLPALEPAPRASALQREKSALQLESGPRSAQLGGSPGSSEDPAQPRIDAQLLKTVRIIKR